MAMTIPPLLRIVLKLSTEAGYTAEFGLMDMAYETPPIGEKLEMPAGTQLHLGTKMLKSLALPRGLEPLFSP